MITIRVGGVGDLKALSRRLHRAAAGGLQGELNREIRATARPVTRAVKAAARALPDGPPPKSTGLRRAIARSTLQVAIPLGARVWVDPSLMPPNQRNLPYRTNDGHWRHPLFGNRRHWYGQTSRAAWFDTTVAGWEPEFTAACERAMEKIAAQIAG